MKNLQVRHVPERTHAELRRRAAAAGMSLQDYVLALLNDTVERPTVDEVLARAENRRGGRIGLAAAARHLRTERARH